MNLPFLDASPAAFDTLCPYGHGALPGPGDTREGEQEKNIN